MALTAQEHGGTLSLRFLKMCEEDGATGTAILNAIGNAAVGFFMVTKFESHEDRMKEVDHWCEALRKEIAAQEN